MAGRNGAGAYASPRVPIKLAPETITYTFERPDGELVSLAGYKKGPGCPVSVAIEVDEALATVEENEPNAEDEQALAPRRYLARLLYAERTLRREMLQAVIPGLTSEDANLLASDGGPWQDILVELGWRQPNAESIAADGDDDAGEAGAGASIGPDGSPASASPTPAETR